MGAFFLKMTYTITIDQTFAQDNELTLVQSAALSTCINLLQWSETVTLDGKVWYNYSEQKMSEDFPLLFGIPKRVYKNFAELEQKGYIQTQKIGKKKYLRLTEKTSYWGRFRNGSPKTDEKESEIGPKKSPKMDADYIINNNPNININNNQEEKKIKKEEKTLFRNSSVWDLVTFDKNENGDYSALLEQFKGDDYANINIVYYFHAVADWSDQSNTKRTARGWIATIRNFIRSDIERGKLHKIPDLQAPKEKYDALKYLNDEL